MLNVLLAGQKWFGAEVYRSLSKLGNVKIVAVSAPVLEDSIDRLAAIAELNRTPLIIAGTLCCETMPSNVDLIVAAHSFDFIGQKTRLRAKFGGIGYHPSLLPLHRGRDSVRWALRMGDRVTGGTVYRLSNKMDGGDILAQRHVFIQKGDTDRELWERDLCPLGVELLTNVVKNFADNGYQHGVAQNETIATWEPSIDRPPAFRPDLLLIGNG